MLLAKLSGTATRCWTEWYGECVDDSGRCAEHEFIDWVGEEEEGRGKRWGGRFIYL
jgi:hypothetical protein